MRTPIVSSLLLLAACGSPGPLSRHASSLPDTAGTIDPETAGLVARASLPAPTPDALVARDVIVDRMRLAQLDARSVRMLLTSTLDWLERFHDGTATNEEAALCEARSVSPRAVPPPDVECVRRAMLDVGRAAYVDLGAARAPLRAAVIEVSGARDSCPDDGSDLAAFATVVRERYLLERRGPREREFHGAPGRCTVATVSGAIELTDAPRTDDAPWMSVLTERSPSGETVRVEPSPGGRIVSLRMPANPTTIVALEPRDGQWFIAYQSTESDVRTGG